LILLSALFHTACNNLTGGEKTTVSSVTVSPATATVVKGETQTFTAAVAGTASPAQTVRWNIDEPFVSGTAITANGGGTAQVPGTEFEGRKKRWGPAKP
jgi:uncharacterized protein YjdB